MTIVDVAWASIGAILQIAAMFGKPRDKRKTKRCGRARP